MIVHRRNSPSISVPGLVIGVWIGLIVMSVLASAQIHPSDDRVVNSNFGSDSGADFRPQISTDGLGTWITVWYSNENVGGSGTDNDILFAVSLDDGGTWSPPELLNSNGTTDSASDETPVILTDCAGTWIATWVSQENLNGAGSDQDIFYSRSLNNGTTWSAPELLNSDATSDVGDDSSPAISTDKNGVWIVVWESNENRAGTGTDSDIFFARSEDNGISWSGPAILNSNATTGNGADVEASVKAGSGGLWLVAWASEEDYAGAGIDYDILFSHSSDNGMTWSAAAVLNTNAISDGGIDRNPSVETDGSGTWLTVWEATENLNGAGSDFDIFVSRSLGNSAVWSPPLTLNTTANSDTGIDVHPEVRTDGWGNWVAAWESFEDFNGAGSDGDIFFARSVDKGASWSVPVYNNINDPSVMFLIGDDQFPALATDGLGKWISVWESNEPFTLPDNSDADIFCSKFALNPVISGRVFSPNNGVVTCAVVEVRKQGDNTIRVAVTDLNGEYLLEDLPGGIYDVRLFSSDYGSTSAGVVDLTGGPLSDIDLQFVPPTAGRTVRGQIVDQDTGEPLVGASAEALLQNAVFATSYTCASGDYLLELPDDMIKGSLTIDLRFSLPNYETKTIEGIEVTGDATEANESLVKSVPFPASLAGVVYVAASDPPQPVRGARVTLRGPANTSASSSENGTYLFPAILGGYYTVSVSREGFESQAVGTTVPQDGAEAKSFALVAIEGSENPNPSDIDGNNQVNAVDVQLVINAALGIDIGSVNADVNGDNAVNAVDVQLVINAALGLDQ